MIQKVYQNQTGHAVDLSGVVLAVQAYATKQDVLAELSAASGSISSELKEEIIRPAYVMLLADNRLAGQEHGMLKDSARLKISEIRLWAIVESIDPSSAKDSSPRGAPKPPGPPPSPPPRSQPPSTTSTTCRSRRRGGFRVTVKRNDAIETRPSSAFARGGALCPGSEADIQLTSKMSAKFHKRRANVVGKGVESGLKNRLV